MVIDLHLRGFHARTDDLVRDRLLFSLSASGGDIPARRSASALAPLAALAALSRRSGLPLSG